MFLKDRRLLRSQRIAKIGSCIHSWSGDSSLLVKSRIVGKVGGGGGGGCDGSEKVLFI